MYTELIEIKGHIMTPDQKYYLKEDSKGFSYWHKIENRNDKEHALKRLNDLLDRKKNTHY